MESQASSAEPPESPPRGLGMMRRPGEHWTRFAARVANAFGVVLLLVVTIYVLGSLVSYSGWTGSLLAAVTSACVLVALVSAEAPPGLVRGAAGFAGAAVVLSIIGAAAGKNTPTGLSALIAAVLLFVAAIEVLATVISEREVGFRTILGAISVYVILGILFTFVYAGIDKFQSGPFFGTPTQTGDYVFFSVTTLTTTGYGNLIPATSLGRMTAGLEMLIGQVFLVTLIAGLVSLWRPGTWTRRRDRKPS